MSCALKPLNPTMRQSNRQRFSTHSLNGYDERCALGKASLGTRTLEDYEPGAIPPAEEGTRLPASLPRTPPRHVPKEDIGAFGRRSSSSLHMERRI